MIKKKEIGMRIIKDKGKDKRKTRKTRRKRKRRRKKILYPVHAEKHIV